MSSPSLPTIAILLGTYQGERFLARQLDTVEGQSVKDWALWASDDGSSDATLTILNQYRERWGPDRLPILRGPSSGFRANFMSLACNPSIRARYYAFCDQDDLWDADKLEVALAWIRSIPEDVPALYCARTRLIDEDDRSIGYSPLFPRPSIFENALVQSIAGGNTMLFNQAARALLIEAGADVVVQTHDWWAYMVVSGCGGRVFYDAIPKVGYRQHGANLVGSNASWSGRTRRFRRILQGDFSRMNDQNIAALRRIEHRLTPHNRKVFETFTRARSQGFAARVSGVHRSGVYCQNLLSNIALSAATLLKRI